MKGRQHPSNDLTLNASRDNESIRDVIARVEPSRRTFLKGSVGAGVVAALGGVGLGLAPREASAHGIRPGPGFAGIGFTSVPPNRLDPITGLLQKDLVTVPRGYRADVLVAWGDPVVRGAPAWDVSAQQDAAAQERQSGMHHDGMHYFEFRRRGRGRFGGDRGLLCVNHEYTDENQLHGFEGLAGGAGVTIAKVRKSQAAHGVSVQEVAQTGRGWTVRRNSRFGRRITANTPMRVSGPAAGNPLLKSKRFAIDVSGSYDTGTTNDGYTAFGTANNCAHGYTPWGTYLTCEENWNGYFAAPTLGAAIDPNLFDQKGEIIEGKNRYGISRTGFGYQWHVVDPRWNADTNPLEPNLFGWVVEIDPFDPQSVPVKRTALGRMKHESAQVVVDDDRYVAFYMGDDERNEYVYKFVCARPMEPRRGEADYDADDDHDDCPGYGGRRWRARHRDMLDHGTLYVAKFNADGTGVWLPLVWGQNGLTPENGFANQGEVLIKTRQAADRLGATMMDRPEWTAARPRIGGFREIEVYCTLTNNSRRGETPVSVNQPDGSTAAGGARPPVDAANPRPDNDYGHIIRWRESGRSVRATTFRWDLFVQCGDKQVATLVPPKALASRYTPTGHDGYVGNIVGDDYGAPDGLWFDDYGRLWIQTDQAGDGLGDWANIGGNVMMCADPNTGQTRRFLTSPTDCEVTGVITTPDHRTMFVNIQHPGDRGTPTNPTAGSNWPHSQGYGPSGRPRSATVVITKADGGIIGT
jgi:secreted PhoX family phosphatase